MSSTGNTFPQTGENNAGIGATAWADPGNIVNDTTTDSICAAAASSQYLVARNFGFSIPTNATVQGVLVRIEASEHSGGTEALRSQLQNDSAALVGSAKTASNEGNISGTAKAVYTYGSTSDLWGATLTPTIINDPDFGVRFWFVTAHEIRVDFVTLAVEYAIITTQTQTAVARIRKTLDKTQVSQARIRKTQDRTQIAKAAVTRTIDQTQAALARVQRTVDETQVATARIGKTQDKTQTAIAKITGSAVIPILVMAPYRPT